MADSVKKQQGKTGKPGRPKGSTTKKETAGSSRAKKQKQAKILEKARKKYGINPEYSKIETIKEEKEIKVNEINESNNLRRLINLPFL